MTSAQTLQRIERRRLSRTSGDPVTQLVEAHLWLVEVIVNSLSANWPRHVERGELVAAGRLGLVEAAQRFEPERGVDFPAFAKTRVRGALLDVLRSDDWAPRRVRAKSRLATAAVEQRTHQMGRDLEPDERATAAGMSTHALDRLAAETERASLLSLDAPASGADGDEALNLAEVLLCPAATALQRLEDREMLSLLDDAVNLLDERPRRVIEGYFLKGDTSADLARELGVTESRISQIRSEALQSLNSVLAAQWAPPAPEPPEGRRARRAADYASAVAGYRTWRQRLDEQGLTRVQRARAV